MPEWWMNPWLTGRQAEKMSGRGYAVLLKFAVMGRIRTRVNGPDNLAFNRDDVAALSIHNTAKAPVPVA
jgi:hypothetical protein